MFAMKSALDLPYSLLRTRTGHLANQPISVAEINIGIAASCMPVIFVLFKNSTGNKFFLAIRLWISTKCCGSRGRMETPSGASSGGSIEETDATNLLGIPRRGSPGLRNIGRTNPVASHENHFTLMLTDVSEVDDHHDHLRNG